MFEWKPSAPRTEIVSIDTGRLANHAVGQMGLVSLRLVPVAEGTQIIIGAFTDLSPKPGAEIWLSQPNDADRILDELFTIDELTSSREEDGSVLIKARLDEVAAAIANCARWRRVRLVTDAEIDARISIVKQEIDRALVRLQSTGWMSTLNKQYKDLRARSRTEGAKTPSYKVWMSRQLEKRILELIPTAAPSLWPLWPPLTAA